MLQNFLILRRRKLTSGEISLAREIFSSHLNYDSIFICAHRLVLKHYAISPNGHIYFNVIDWCEDFSTQSIEMQSWLIHELVHVWQVQQGIKLIRKAIFERQYHYVLKRGKTFLEFGVEQQAQMVQDYFLKKHRQQSCDDLAACIPFIASRNKKDRQMRSFLSV
ncbi:type IV secretion protein Rhs [Acinetobacter soli]|nr:type IV secretion protein Rhs [Acinetobacter soli]WEH91158.1 type IV secretion protein Rhs [Acinetobacter soli]WEH99668.1 type IV secretion protein Rhs [Acinetobacter soli]